MSTTVSYKGSTIATVNNNTKTLKTEGKYLEADVILTDDSSISLQSKSVSPTESQQSVSADNGYDGLSTVTVGAISSTYVGTGITRRSSTDLTVSGATVTVPTGYYSAQASKSVATGSAGTPSASKGTVSNHSVSVTPTVTNTTGYITGGTKTGTAVSVSASELVSGTLSITSAGTKDVTNYASASVSAGTEGTPTATKGTVSNHSVSVTPSVTNTGGFISGTTKTGTAVTVSASELVSGTLSITSSGTKDVTNYASVSVPSGTEGTPTATKGTVTNHSITVTPTVTNTGGYISGGTKNGTGVTVSARELTSGTLWIYNPGYYDVTNYRGVTHLFKPMNPIVRPDASVDEGCEFYGGGFLVEDMGITLPTWSTSTQYLQQSQALGEPIALDFDTYSYYITQQATITPIYSITSRTAGRQEYSFTMSTTEFIRLAGSDIVSLTHGDGSYDPVSLSTDQIMMYPPSFNSLSGLVYMSGNDILSYYDMSTSTKYGAYAQLVSPSYNNGMLTLYSPNVIIRGNNTYFNQTYFNALTDISIEYAIILWNVSNNNDESWSNGWQNNMLARSSLIYM